MKYIKVFLLFKEWKDNLETGRKAGTGILVTSKERSVIQMGSVELRVSAPSLTIAGSTAQKTGNEISFWLDELSSFEEYLTIPDEYRGDAGCYLGFKGDLSSMQSKQFLTQEQFNSLSSDERVFAFAS